MKIDEYILVGRQKSEDAPKASLWEKKKIQQFFKNFGRLTSVFGQKQKFIETKVTAIKAGF